MGVRNLQFILSGKDNVSSTFDKVGRKADGLGSKLGGAAKAGAVGLGVAGVAGALSFGKASVGAFMESEESAARLDDALKRFPKTADTNAKKLGKINEALARKTRFDDDATASGQAVLAQFGLTGKQLEQMTPLLQDYAAKTGKDLPTAARDLGKAVLGQGRALKDIGLDFKDTGSAAGNLEQLQKGLNKQVGGFAEKEGKTAAGRAEILRNQWGELQETVGSKLVPVLSKLAEKVLGVIQGFQDGTGTGGKLRDAFEKIKKTIEENRPQLEKLGRAIAAIAEVIVTKVLPMAVKFQTEVISKIVSGVGLVVDGFTGLKDAATGVARWVIDKFLGIVGTIVNAAASAFGWVPGLGPKLKNAAKEFEAFKKAVNISLGNLQDQEVTIRLKKVEVGARETNRVQDEKTVARAPSMPGTGRRANVAVTSNVVLDGRVVATSGQQVLAGDRARGYVAVA